MRYILFPILAVVLFSGCEHEPTPGGCEKTKIIKTKCPKFTSRLSIEVLELNTTHAAISWRDVSRIEHFLKDKKRFNERVDSLSK